MEVKKHHREHNSNGTGSKMIIDKMKQEIDKLAETVREKDG